MKKNANAYSILVVDDEVELCEAVSVAFEIKGHKVQQAPNGRRALDVVKTQKVDLVLSDVRMSEGDGIELLRYIKDMNINRPLVALMTGYADVTRDQMYDLGAEAVFEKPFKVMELIRQLTKSLDTKDARWSEKPNIRPVFKIQQDVELPKTFNLGRGGFFVAVPSGEPQNGQFIEFDLGFKNDDALNGQRLQGYGIVRWVRPETPVACGVEFVYLAEPMRATVLQMIEKTNARTFIPKG